MKKAISLVLCLAMLFSIFSVCGVVAGAADANDSIYVKSNGFVNDQITYTIYVKKNITFTGAIVKAQFDPAVLEPVMYWSDGNPGTTDDDGYVFENNGAYVTKDSYGDVNPNVSGLYVSGMVSGYTDMCSVGFVNMDGYKTGSSDKAFMTFTFKAISDARPVTNVKFYCAEFMSTNESLNIPKNDTDPQMFYEHSTSTLNKTKLTSVYSIDGGLRITWEPTPGATGYKVYDMNESAYHPIAEVPATQTSFDDMTVTHNAKARYTVRSYNSYATQDSGYAGAIEGYYVKAPDKVTATNQAKSVKLTWTAVDGATSYRIFRRVINADGTRGAWQTLATVSSPAVTYVDSNGLESGTKYEYTVRVFTKLGSSAVCRYAVANYFEAPTVKLASVTGGMKVTWNKIDGATSYKVYRKYYGAKSYSLIAVVSGDTLSYIDGKAESGKGISYTVRAYGDEGSSAYVGKYLNYVQTPILLGISNSAKGAYFRWSKVNGATGYRLYRKGLNDKSWTYLKTVTTTYYTDTTAKPGYHYYYTVIAVNKNNVYSGFDPVGLYTKFITTPKLTKITNASNGITVNWNSVYGVGYYEVYRKVGNAKTWTYVTTVKATSFTDTNVQKGVTYTYTVRAKFNNIFSGYDTTGLKIKR